MVISVIIPTLNEEVNLPVTLRQLANHPDVELIVVDGGSMDRTCELAQGFTPYVFRTLPNRASQMNLGARHATGDILLFLHADTFLLPGALEEVQRRIIGDGAVGGAFDLHIDSRRHLCGLVARAASRRSRWLRLPATGVRGAGRVPGNSDHGRCFVRAAVAARGTADVYPFGIGHQWPTLERQRRRADHAGEVVGDGALPLAGSASADPLHL